MRAGGGWRAGARWRGARRSGRRTVRAANPATETGAEHGDHRPQRRVGEMSGVRHPPMPDTTTPCATAGAFAGFHNTLVADATFPRGSGCRGVRRGVRALEPGAPRAILGGGVHEGAGMRRAARVPARRHGPGGVRWRSAGRTRRGAGRRGATRRGPGRRGAARRCATRRGATRRGATRRGAQRRLQPRGAGRERRCAFPGLRVGGHHLRPRRAAGPRHSRARRDCDRPGRRADHD